MNASRGEEFRLASAVTALPPYTATTFSRTVDIYVISSMNINRINPSTSYPVKV